MEDEAILREKARAAISTRGLPAFRRPSRVWTGSGLGAVCAVCELPVQRYELECEIQFEHGADPPLVDRFHLHLRCFAVWELERHGGDAGRVVPLPPLSETRKLRCPHCCSADIGALGRVCADQTAIRSAYGCRACATEFVLLSIERRLGAPP
jgi:hypothetical protein